MRRAVTIRARWEWSPEDIATALVAGSEWLGYIMHPTEDGQQYIACIGSGIDAPPIGGGSLEECKRLILDALTP